MQYEICFHPVSRVVEVKLPELLNLAQWYELLHELHKLGFDNSAKDIYVHLIPIQPILESEFN